MLGSLLKRLGLSLSLNDPQWGRGSQNNNQDGKKKPDTPPDLEQVWKDLNARLARFLGQKGGGSGNGGGEGGGFSPDPANTRIGIGAIALVFFVVWLISGIFIVQEGQTAVITTFGKYSHVAGSGMNWRWPYPVQSHEIVNVSQVRTVEVGYRSNVKNKQARESLMLTDDENIIDIQFAVQYKLGNAADWLFNNRDQDEMIRQVAETAVREVVGKSKMDFVLYEGREKVALDVGALMQQILAHYKSGVQIANVTMQGVQPPEQVQAAFDDAVKAGQDKERQKNEGQAYANDVIPKARGEASRMLQEAEGYKSRVVANAEGNASRFKQVLSEYQKAPVVTRDRLYLETMQQIFSSTSKLMMDTKSSNNMVYLPLDKMIQQAEGSTAKAPAAAVAPVTPSEPIPTVEMRYSKDGRSRDSRDSRDREVR
ncbi:MULTISPECIES: FtsH protease activity modulator HflK [unclassified Undibacterium]|uniref:FtsH protease activity modulator HflK n=1 Tax=unclassified Undibacterium TaxID=2630295 RepID=UPI002AC89DEA|nr:MULTISPECIES: FtsH protease activity modulator HflK [unclassified Undibacterium]MEB0138368.1 FtsH protease activity modulator HflK [Undibacterium sp. CCC2.1]MEB0172745.1 FtsH protease activity modulator HflK [Undibacterium sp. CCC1.1]MEB0174743.1 FtsH protease activity modulator HflK [Undibacterium sp. CCC3.4]MEB0213940.1 FtsH protease activity modulator HflK [Undibacterium sp. 5I2]WPX42663.1 FtsH protease activity modulator HflK [Undibacterium sp. CCC3.4]